MFGLPRSATLLWLVVVAAGLGVVVASTLAVTRDSPTVALVALLLAVAGAIGESFFIPVRALRPGHGVSVSVSNAIFVAAILVLPAHWAALTAVVAYAAAQVAAPKRPWFKTLYNLAHWAVSVGAASLVWRIAVPTPAPLSLSMLPALGATLATYFVLETVPIAAIVSLATGMPVRLTWWRSYRHVLPTVMSTLFVGVLIAVLWTTAAWLIVMAAVPLAGLFYALRNTIRLENQTVDALFALADVIDARDPYTHGHCLRVGQYAEELALAHGCSDDMAHLVFLAGRLHDVGKCAVNNEVLLKPGPLDADERAHMSRHPAVGGAMLEHFTLFHECAVFVRGHHERWDGDGYPDGLAGDTIPIGARIIAVVDAYDAMTTTRPYRTALSHEEALRRLQEGAGTQWDPTIVTTFLQLAQTSRRIPAPGVARPLAAPPLAA